MLNYHTNKHNALFWAAIEPSHITKSHLTQMVANFRTKQHETSTTSGKTLQRHNRLVHIQGEGPRISSLMALPLRARGFVGVHGMAASREAAMLV
jgi:hypothetical protein